MSIFDLYCLKNYLKDHFNLYGLICIEFQVYPKYSWFINKQRRIVFKRCKVLANAIKNFIEYNFII